MRHHVLSRILLQFIPTTKREREIESKSPTIKIDQSSGDGGGVFERARKRDTEFIKY